MGSQRVRYGLATEQQQQENKWKREDGKVVVAVRPSQANTCVCVCVCVCVCTRACVWGCRGGPGAKAAGLLLFRSSHWEGYVTARRGLC